MVNAGTTAALDVLLDALPTEQASSIAQEFTIDLPTPASTQSAPQFPTSTAASFTTISTATSSVPKSTQILNSSTLSATPTTSTTPATVSAQSTSSGAAAAAATSPPPSHDLSAGAVTGIIAGSIAGALLIVILCFFVLRWRKRSSSKHGSTSSSLLGSIRRKKPQVYPEVAWLYDPVRPASRQARPSVESVERLYMGANAPWNSRPSTGQDREGGHSRNTSWNSTVEMTDSSRPTSLNAAVVQPPPRRERSLSAVRQHPYASRPLDPHRPSVDNGPDELVSPLLPAPPRPFHRYGRDTVAQEEIIEYDPATSSIPARRSQNVSPSTENRTPLNAYYTSNGMGRAF